MNINLTFRDYINWCDYLKAHVISLPRKVSASETKRSEISLCGEIPQAKGKFAMPGRGRGITESRGTLVGNAEFLGGKGSMTRHDVTRQGTRNRDRVSSTTCGPDPWHMGRWDFMTLCNAAKVILCEVAGWLSWRHERTNREYFIAN